MDKLFLHAELFALRCVFKNLPMLCPTLIESLFYEVFYTKDGLDFPSAHGHRPVRPTHLGPSGLVFCFYPLQLPPSPHLVRRCCEILKYSQVYEPYRSIVGQERGRIHRDLNERRKIKSNLNQISPNPV